MAEPPVRVLMQKMKKVRRQMTSNLTPAELDKIEAVARADIAVRVAPPTPGEPGRGLREVCEFLEVATSRNVLALVAEVRELRAKVERVLEFMGNREGEYSVTDDFIDEIRDALGEEA